MLFKNLFLNTKEFMRLQFAKEIYKIKNVNHELTEQDFFEIECLMTGKTLVPEDVACKLVNCDKWEFRELIKQGKIPKGKKPRGKRNFYWFAEDLIELNK